MSEYGQDIILQKPTKIIKSSYTYNEHGNYYFVDQSLVYQAGMSPVFQETVIYVYGDIVIDDLKFNDNIKLYYKHIDNNLIFAITDSNYEINSGTGFQKVGAGVSQYLATKEDFQNQLSELK